jgi:hypothetical protein
MDINRNNYEAWLLDLIEGKLSPNQVQQVRDFLLLNPDCAEGLNEVEPWILEADKISFPGKADLRKEFPHSKSLTSEVGFDLLSIAMMEGDLTEIQEQEYLQMLEGDEKKMKQWFLWKKITLPDKAVLFEKKGALKKRSASHSRVIWISIASAAAAVLLFFTLIRPDQGLNPSSVLSLEAEPDIKSQIDPQASDSPELQPVFVEESSKKPIHVASEAAIFSIKKHQDPPELTGEKRDSSHAVPNEAELQERPLRIAILERGPRPQADYGSYDRITVLDLQDLTTNLELEEAYQYSENGLRRSYRQYVEDKNISLLSIASAGVEGINQFTGSELSLDVSKDEKGEAKRFRFRSGILSVDSPMKKQNISR